jgi:hypothetical protein
MIARFLVLVALLLVATPAWGQFSAPVSVPVTHQASSFLAQVRLEHVNAVTLLLRPWNGDRLHIAGHPACPGKTGDPRPLQGVTIVPC